MQTSTMNKIVLASFALVLVVLALSSGFTQAVKLSAATNSISSKVPTIWSPIIYELEQPEKEISRAMPSLPEGRSLGGNVGPV